MNLRKWENDVLGMAFTMKRDAATYPGRFGAPPISKPEYGSTKRFLEAVPTHWACMHDSRGMGGGQGRVFNAGGPGGRADERKGGGWGERGGGGLQGLRSKEEQGNVGSLNGGADGLSVTVGSVSTLMVGTRGGGGQLQDRSGGVRKGKGRRGGAPTRLEKGKESMGGEKAGRSARKGCETGGAVGPVTGSVQLGTAGTPTRVEREGKLGWPAALNRLSKAKEGSGQQRRILATVTQIVGEVLARYRGEVKEVVKFLEGEVLAPHLDGDRIHDFFGMRHGFPDIARLEHIAKVGVAVDVGPGGDLEHKIAYGNHSSAKQYEDEVRGEVIADLVRCRSLVFRWNKRKAFGG